MDSSKTEHIKEWLYRYRDASQEAEILEKRLHRLHDKMYSLQAVNLDGMPHSTPDHDQIGAKVARYEELEHEYRNKLEEVKQIYKETKAAIDQITGKGAVHYRSILELRYLDGCKWTEITEAMFGSLDDFEEKQDSYLRKVTLWHGRALKAVSQFIPENEVKDGSQI